MKTILFIAVLFNMTLAQAEIDLKKLEGNWKLSCVQTQNSSKQGFVTETYSFDKTGSFKLEKAWFKMASCEGKAEAIDVESGSLTIGKENTNNGFNPAGTHEAQFKTSQGTEQGLLWVNESFTKLRLARGFGQSQNTMLGVFQYTKQK